ncbi:hypothetical protein N7465_002763 [Penicillium sp. CMV-2018d]|nr:hypothetical protein N7465_002763 [Penicillium sp. CMV-2018d]
MPTPLFTADETEKRMKKEKEQPGMSLPKYQQNAASKNTSNPKPPKEHHKNATQPPKPPLLLIPKPSYPLRHSHWSPTRPHGSEADTATPDSGATSPFPILSRAIDPTPYTLSPQHPRIRSQGGPQAINTAIYKDITLVKSEL